MDKNERIYRKSIVDKYGFEEIDHDFNSDGGWASYQLSHNIPPIVKNPFNADDINSENLSEITVNIDDVDVNWEYDSGTYIGEPGGPGGWYERPGTYADSVDCSSDAEFLWDGSEITKEQFKEINGISDEELGILIDYIKGYAESAYEEWAQENLDPPEYEPDYDDSDYDY